MPIAQVKRGIQAVLLNDMEMLKDAINDTENVYTGSIPSFIDKGVGGTGAAAPVALMVWG